MEQQPFCCPQRATTTRQKKGFALYNVGNGGILFAKHTNIILAGVSHKNHFAKKRSVGGSGPVRQNSLEPSSAKPPPSFFRQRTPFSSSPSSSFSFKQASAAEGEILFFGGGRSILKILLLFPRRSNFDLFFPTFVNAN